MAFHPRIPAWYAVNWWRNLDWRGRMLLLAIVLLGICLAEPHAKLPRRVYDWFFVLDITQSMNVRDTVVHGNSMSRLEFSKRVMRQALRRLPCGSRVALGLFTERSTANIQYPLEVCAHFGALDETIARMDWRMAWAADSYIAHGLYSAVGQAPKLGENMRVAFFSDGHQAPVASARYAPVFEGEPGAVKGLVLGTGLQTAGRIPKLDERDNVTGYWEADDVQRYATFGISELQSVLQMEQQEKGYHGRNAPHGSHPDETSNAHFSALDGANLRKLAKATGLDYMQLDSANDFTAAMTSGKMSVWRSARTDLRPWLVVPAMLLILAFFMPPAFYQFFQQHLLSRKKT
ncbi:mxaL protein [Methylophilaceae bacterium]|nr:mxaL protein [Methylophilaceae bacterium]